MMELKPINYNEEIVITTKTLAKVYECKELQIQQNYNNNKDKFEEGKHYFKVEGKELKELKNQLDNFEVVTGYGKRTSCIYLWTKRGASRHCKMLGTDKAWEMFDTLEENYFNPKMSQLTRKEELLLKLFSKDPMEVAKAHEELVELEKKPLLDKIEKDEPKVTFANRVLKSNDNVLVRQVAKMASDEGFVIGERKLYKKLREWGYICNDSTEPTQVGMNRNYFTLKVNVLQTQYGIKTSRTTLVTPKGQIHIVKRLMKEMENDQ